LRVRHLEIADLVDVPARGRLEAHLDVEPALAFEHLAGRAPADRLDDVEHL
jgi:hypothetical protein